jgi:4-amino-4-deoxy-L-arabinose transferase-like glycosyltransferase
MKKLLFIILLLAIVLRFYSLGSIPRGFHVDEAAFGYNAYSILKTGKDEYGQRFPLVLRSFGDYKGALYSYITVPFIYLFGLNEWSVRAPSAVFGILFVLLTYLLTYQLSRSREIAVTAMGFAAISPLGILLSRVQSDPLVSVTILYLGVYCLLLWIEHHRFSYFICFFCSVILSFFTNTVTRVFVLPFMVLMGCSFWRDINIRMRVLYICTFVCIGIIIFGLVLTPAGSRFRQISVFGTQNVQLPLEEEIREDGMQAQPIIVARLFHNKVSDYSKFLLHNYSEYMSFNFLFVQAVQPLREQIPDMGVLLLAELPFLLIGIYTAIKQKLRYGLISLLWFLLVPAVLSFASDETPNIHRFFLALIPIHILVSVGVVTVYRLVSKQYRNVVVGLIILILLINEVYFLHQLFVHQPVHDPVFRSQDYTLLAKSMGRLHNSYDVVVSPKILEHLLFYWEFDPARYQQMGSPRDDDNSWFGNILFTGDECPSELLNPSIKLVQNKRVLYIDKAQCQVSENDKIVETVRYANTLEAYRLVEKL